MDCYIKYNLNESYQIFKFNYISDIPTNIVGLKINEIQYKLKTNKNLDLTEFKNLIELFIETIFYDINTVKLTTNFEEIKIKENNIIEKLSLLDCNIYDINVLKKFKYLKELVLKNTKIDLSNISQFNNLETLELYKFNDIINLDLNNLYKLNKLVIVDFKNLENLYINELKNLKYLTLGDLRNLRVLNFEKSRLELLRFNRVMDLMYIDGFTRNGENYNNKGLAYPIEQKIIQRKRIYLLCESKVGVLEEVAETPTKGHVEAISESKNSVICGRCGKYVSKYCKINIRNHYLFMYQLYGEPINFYKVLTCC